MFDAMMVFVLSLAIMLGLHAILQIDAKIDKLNAYRTEYAAELGLDLDISTEEYDAMTEEDRKVYDDLYLELNKKMAQNEDVMNLNANIITLISITVTGSLLVGTAIWYFVIPIFFKHGRTLGKKIFGLAVVRTNGVKLTNPVLFARSLIGFYAIETMFPLTLILMTLFGALGIVGFITVGLFLVLQIFVMAYTKTNSCIHDLLSDTVVVDMASQQIFETQDERTEYDKAEAARKAAEAENGGQPIATGVFAPQTQATQTPKNAETNVVTIAEETKTETVTAEIAEVAEVVETTPQAEEKPAEQPQPEQPAAINEKTPQETPSAQTTEQADNAENAENPAQAAE